MEAIHAWDGLSLTHRVNGGNRNEVWKASMHGEAVSVRKSRRSEASLAWELDVLHLVADRGFQVATPLATTDGRWSHEGVVVQRWIEGREPASQHDWELVATELQRIHAVCADVGQRPGCHVVTELVGDSHSVDADLSCLPDNVVTVVLELFESFAAVPQSLVHGDPGASNIRITDADTVVFLDWDESRVDLTWHDLSNLGVQVLSDTDHQRAVVLSNAWEAINAWSTEPEYAQRRFAQLRFDHEEPASSRFV